MPYYRYWIVEYETYGETDDKIFADFMNRGKSWWSLFRLSWMR